MPSSRGISAHLVAASVCLCGLLAEADAAEIPVLFQYDGNASSLMAVMDEAGDGAGGTGVFAGAGFQANMVNVFVADLRNSSTLSGAGVTLFAMWGNGSELDEGFFGSVLVTPPDPFGNPLEVGEGEGTSFAGDPEIFALGEGVSVRPADVSVLGELPFGDETPRGFAITNLQGMEIGELAMEFEVGGSIDIVGLFDWGDTEPYIPPYRCALILFVPIPIPLPPAIALGAAGLLGVVLLRRRLAA